MKRHPKNIKQSSYNQKNYQGSPPTPGQFYHPPSSSQPPKRRYSNARVPVSRQSQVGLVAGVVVVLFFFVVSYASHVAAINSAAVTSTPTNTNATSNANTARSFNLTPTEPISIATAIPTSTQVKINLPTPKPTHVSTRIPQHVPLPTRIPQPTPTPHPTGVDGNPWGYDFIPGNLIYNPPANFCLKFNCIVSFWHYTNGYVVECNDSTFSHSGGVRGACSRHGGVMRALYSH